MRMAFGNLFDDVAPLIEKGARPLSQFKDYLQRCFPTLKPRLGIAKSFKTVIEIVQEKCTMINIACLEGIVERYHIKTAERHITTYKETVDTFCGEIKLSVCESAKLIIGPSSYLKCEKIEFVLEWNTDEHTLDEIRGLLWKAFGDMANKVLVKKAEEGNSIIVTCNAPQYIMDTLSRKAEENLELLKKEGVVKLTIGYKIIWDAPRIYEPVPTQEPLLEPVSIKDPLLDPIPTKKHLLDAVPTQEPSLDPVPFQKPSLDPVSIKEPSLDPVTIKEPSLDPRAIKKPLLDLLPTQETSLDLTSKNPH